MAWAEVALQPVAVGEGEGAGVFCELIALIKSVAAETPSVSKLEVNGLTVIRIVPRRKALRKSRRCVAKNSNEDSYDPKQMFHKNCLIKWLKM